MNEAKRTWERPQANVQTFQMNDYVSACYEVYCWTPYNNSYGYLFEDTNNDGHLDIGDSLLVRNRVRGDRVAEHTGSLPQNNGFWLGYNDNGDIVAKPIFIFYGKAVAGGLNIHASDLSDPTNEHAVKNIATSDHPNRS